MFAVVTDMCGREFFGTIRIPGASPDDPVAAEQAKEKLKAGDPLVLDDTWRFFRKLTPDGGMIVSVLPLGNRNEPTNGFHLLANTIHYPDESFERYLTFEARDLRGVPMMVKEFNADVGTPRAVSLILSGFGATLTAGAIKRIGDRR